MEFTRSEMEQSKILVIDDNPANVLLLEKMLRLNRFRNIMTLTDPRQAYDSIHQYHPDLILLDLQMPYLNGFEILEWLKNHNETGLLPVLVITASDQKEDKLRALSLGASDFLGKPFDHLEVLIRIGNLLKMKGLHNQLQDSNHLLEKKVKRRTEDIKKLQVEVIDRLMRAAEFRDQVTGNHIVRIGEYTYLLAKKLGYEEEEAILISMASKMHDIGKVGIPDIVLLKAATLSPEEMRLMRTHTTIGAQILAGSKYYMLQIAEQIAKTHHEHWDGNGYPDGLKGEEIPLAGRITALADVFDALISTRSYKEKWPIEQVRSYIKEQRGRQFDPVVVDAFFASTDEISEVLEKFMTEDG
jgi:putative two-component system response regulator